MSKIISEAVKTVVNEAEGTPGGADQLKAAIKKFFKTDTYFKQLPIGNSVFEKQVDKMVPGKDHTILQDGFEITDLGDARAIIESINFTVIRGWITGNEKLAFVQLMYTTFYRGGENVKQNVQLQFELGYATPVFRN